jgi:hypothetical protein
VALLGAEDRVVVVAPLTARMEVAIPGSGGMSDQTGVHLTAELTVPADAPADLGVGGFVRDRDGHWFQRNQAGMLRPGRHVVELSLTAADMLVAEPWPQAWTPDAAASCRWAGIVLWSTGVGTTTVTVHRLEATPVPVVATAEGALRDLRLDGLGADGCARAKTGQRWTLSCLPDPLPGNPYDPDAFRLDLVVTEPAGGVLRLPGFWQEPLAMRDRGDREDVVPTGAGSMQVRFRPSRSGHYRMRLEGVWRNGAVHSVPLPDLDVTGEARDQYVRVDATDPRFFAVDGRFWWPVGLNLHDTYDLRSHDTFNTALTPARGTQVYRDMLARCAAAGMDACEIWLSSWNLGLEWRDDWIGYRGLGRYSQANAARLDAVLDEAWAHGMRVNLVINNHGQASIKTNTEWALNPWNSANGGPLAEAADLFSDPLALAGQDKVRRYIIARWADHPAVLGWKLWSEVQLTAARPDEVVAWHEQAAARWRSLDAYRHPITTHWAGQYTSVNPAICRLPGIDYLCIDAYRAPHADEGGWTSIAGLLADSTDGNRRGLRRYGKPVLVTEYGGGAKEGPEEVREADLATAAWVGLVSGHAGAPMCWWWEWVDQGGRWQSFGAIRRFIAGEDLRGPNATAAELKCQDGRLWARAWTRPGRMLAYVQDVEWASGRSGGNRIEGASVRLGAAVAPGAITCEWWDADRGVVREHIVIQHPGGPLTLPVPAFARHCAVKVWR